MAQSRHGTAAGSSLSVLDDLNHDILARRTLIRPLVVIRLVRLNSSKPHLCATGSPSASGGAKCTMRARCITSRSCITLHTNYRAHPASN
jgi:hypothetical protein